MANYLKQSESNIHEKGEFMNIGLVESWICSYLRLQGCKWASLSLFLPNNQIMEDWFPSSLAQIESAEGKKMSFWNISIMEELDVKLGVYAHQPGRLQSTKAR